MKLFSYVVTHDTGFSPNPFWGYCTLACCKPSIRKTASVGDWIAGLTPKAKGNRLIYAMRVGEILPYDEYYHDIRFIAKIPDYSKKLEVHRCGDNIYEPLSHGKFRQVVQSKHSNEFSENCKHKDHDLRVLNVLISDNFYYFGSQALVLPESMCALFVGRGHRCKFPVDVISAFINFITSCSAGVNSRPTSWFPNDDSWKEEMK